MSNEEMMGLFAFKDDPCIDPPALSCSESIPETIDPSSSEPVAVVGGITPMTWDITGVDVTLENPSGSGRTNTVVAGSGAGGRVTVIVTDACGQSVDCIIRCTSGGWHNIKTIACGNPPHYYSSEYLNPCLRWHYSTSSSAWCPDVTWAPCGFFDVSEHADVHGNVNEILCQDWLP